VVYGRVKSVRHESGRLLDERQRFGRRQEAGRPREQNGKVEQDTDEGIPVVADLKRFDKEGALRLRTRDGGSELDKTPWQDFHPQRSDKNDRHEDAQDAAPPIAGCTV